MLELFQVPPKPQAPSLPRTRQERQSKRFSVPVFDVPIRVELLAAGIRHTGQLWDVSEHGACLLLRSPVEPGQQGLLRIHSPCDGECIEVEAQMMWLDPVMGSYYAGSQFAQPVELASTFLGALIRNAEMLSRTPNRII